MDTHDARGLLDQDGAAEYLHVPSETMRYWRNSRTGPAFVRVGRHVRYRFRDLDRWIESQLVEPQAPAAS
jgi:excisionase family DNA binding protein